MKNLLAAALLFVAALPLAANAQYDPDKVNKKAAEIYAQSIELAQNGDYGRALAGLQEALRRDPNFVDAYLSAAGVYGQLKNHQQSVAFYEKALALDSNYTSDYRLPYSINLAGLGQFAKAKTVIDALLARPSLGASTRKAAEYRQRTYQFALDFEKNNPNKNYVFAPRNLGGGINSADAEYFPTMPVDGSVLIYTRAIRGFNEDFFAAPRKGDQWDSSFRLTGDINTPMNEGAQNISQDGRWLVFTGCNRPDGLGSCDLYISYLTNDGWSQAINLGNKVNSEEWDSQPCLSPDKRDLYFSSRRAGGYGGSDLWVCHLQPNGRWSEPENLGPEINTKGDEYSPFIHADNQTFYFTSNGHPGYGDEDLFVSRLNDAGKWGRPQNLGYPINTIGIEGTLFVAADGKTAYFSSERAEGKGKLDIYSFEMREDIRPARTLWVKGTVSDVRTKAGLPSTVELIDLKTGRTISRLQTDETGNYLVTLPVGKDYAFNVNRRGYLFYSDNFFLREKAPDSTYEKNIALQPIEVNAAIVLRNIFFDYNKFALKTESQVELDRVVQFLQDNPTVKIQLEGHTDNVGNAADNQRLSEARARAVIAYLNAKGIKLDRLLARGFGSAKPVADNKTEAGRAQNRRTELKIIAK